MLYKQNKGKGKGTFIQSFLFINNLFISCTNLVPIKLNALSNRLHPIESLICRQSKLVVQNCYMKRRTSFQSIQLKRLLVVGIGEKKQTPIYWPVDSQLSAFLSRDCQLFAFSFSSQIHLALIQRIKKRRKPIVGKSFSRSCHSTSCTLVGDDGFDPAHQFLITKCQGQFNTACSLMIH